ncbi:MAG TPA: dienelactone hydrolase family protein [Woeseiaceae bacterium]|nr:dienelactone hydrolase family protein [Woeseiaceae bacterium]
MGRRIGRRVKVVAGVVAVVGVLAALAACDRGPDDKGTDPALRDNVDAMSREHADDAGTPSDGAAIPTERAVVAETLPYAEVNEELVYGHFVFPSDMVDPLPGLIVVHEWWGLNDGVRAMADRIAAEGYIVLAVDLFGGKTAESPSQARELMLAALQKPEFAEANLRQAYEFVRDTGGAPRIGSLGWCFGGAWALNAALLLPGDLDAAVIYYGQVPDDEERLAPLNTPILGLFAENDRGIPVESVKGFEQALENLGKDYEIEIYPGVGHAFANPSGNSYNAEVAAQAWDRTVTFLRDRLASGADN